MADKTELSIVLPVFNEEKNIPKVVEKFHEISRKIKIELIFVEDGGSKDKTRSVIKSLSKKYKFIKPLFIEDRGYGISLYKGLESAKGEFIGWTHADLQTNPKDVLRALILVKGGANPKKTYVKGKRYGRSFFDVFFTIGMAFFETILLRRILWDINAQPNIFHKSFFKLMKNSPEDFSFDLYTYYIAKLNNYKIKRFPVYFGKRKHGESSWNKGFSAKMKFIKRTLAFSFELKKSLKS